jgi:hypothetical protein
MLGCGNGGIFHVHLLGNALTVSFIKDDQVINDFTEDVLEEVVSIAVTSASGKHFFLRRRNRYFCDGKRNQ